MTARDRLLVRAARTWNRDLLVESLAWSDDDVLAAADKATDKWWCGQHEHPCSHLAMPSLRPVLRRLRGNGYLTYTSVRQLAEDARAGLHHTGYWPGGAGLWSVTPFGDERLAWVEGTLEYAGAGSPVWIAGRDDPVMA